MATKTLICGLSGTGKSRSMKAFAEENVQVAVVNPVNKPLPFRHNFEMLNGETDSRKIVKFMKATSAKVIVVDDFQYLLAIPYMRRIKETGWDKYNDFAANYFEIIQVCDELPEDVTVYFMTHTETLEDGTETIKLIGKLLREKICIEGLFTIVLKTLVNDGHYYFITQNNGKDTVKSPEDMFPSYAIDNDLKYVDDKIRNYYQIGDCLTDYEMEKKDEEVKNEGVTKENTSGKKKRSRKTREEVHTENDEKLANAGLEEAGDDVEVPFDEVETPKLEKELPKRKNRKKNSVPADVETEGSENDSSDHKTASGEESGADQPDQSPEAPHNDAVSGTGRTRRRRRS